MGQIAPGTKNMTTNPLETPKPVQFREDLLHQFEARAKCAAASHLYDVLTSKHYRR